MRLPYTVLSLFNVIHSSKELTNAFGSLVVDMLELHKHRDKASLYAHNARPKLNIVQRWRLPIVCCKVASGKRLGPADAKVWTTIADRCSVSSASSGAELVAAFAAACESPRTAAQQSSASEHSPKRQQSARSRSPRPDASPRRSPLNRTLTPPRRPSFSTGVAALSSTRTHASSRPGRRSREVALGEDAGGERQAGPEDDEDEEDDELELLTRLEGATTSVSRPRLGT